MMILINKFNDEMNLDRNIIKKAINNYLDCKTWKFQHGNIVDYLTDSQYEEYLKRRG